MPSYSRNEVVLIKYPFSDLTGAKIRPAVVVNSRHASQDLLLVALTSKTTSLKTGEFVLEDWSVAGLNVETAVKRGVFTIHEKLVLKSIGFLSTSDAATLDESLRQWLNL
ncbi:MAG: type II toxin-antitoxin system PemK/MazF family toxin [Blastocatellia bacterium]